jgi:diadenosine tetraphosphate (Ap4A) HIT family hydrolase
LLYCSRFSEHFDAMPATELGGFMADVQRASRALRQLSAVERVNVAILGNREPHVHAYLIPRRPDEPNARGAHGTAPSIAHRWGQHCMSNWLSS